MINIIQADCMDILLETPDKAYELAIVDPPYGIFDEKKRTGFQRNYETQAKANVWDVRPPPEYFRELFRVSKNQIVWGAQYFTDDLPDFSQLIVWDKENGKNYFADGEAAFCSIPGTLRIFRHKWCGCFKASEKREASQHPNQKPVALYRWLLERYAQPGDRILDTHGGSGSILIACEELGYDITWIEKDPESVEIAKNRLKEYRAQGELFHVKQAERVKRPRAARSPMLEGIE